MLMELKKSPERCLGASIPSGAAPEEAPRVPAVIRSGALFLERYPMLIIAALLVAGFVVMGSYAVLRLVKMPVRFKPSI
jgi:hypothetical protein